MSRTTPPRRRRGPSGVRPQLRTAPVHDEREVVEHFDRLAPEYHDAHGHAEGLLEYRVSAIRSLLAAAGGGRRTLVEIGCGTGAHLLALAGEFEQAIGTDASAGMVRVAQDRIAESPLRDRVSVRVDPAEELATVEDASVDVVVCIGSLEHMLDRVAVARQVARVLRPGGAFVCLTPNGGYWWYRYLAPLLRRDTRHLSTDRFLTAGELRDLVTGAGLTAVRIESWRFVPQGDLPRGLGPPLRLGERVGARLGVAWLRGGIAIAATRGDQPDVSR